jgi:putative spermidine/putrescine transport system substrate-binding protein
MYLNRSRVVIAAAFAALLTGFLLPTNSGAAGSAQGGTLPMPSHPVTLNLVDVAGDLQVMQPIIENYAKHFPQYLAKINFDSGDATEIAGKLQAQEKAGQLQVDLLLTGNDALAPSIKEGLLTKLTPTYNSVLGNSMAKYLPGAKQMLDIAQGYAIVDDYGDYGPLLTYLPGKVTNPPTTPQALLDWVKAHPGQFTYGRPSNSGPGRAFVQGLPYILGDSNPMDPINGWAKTWAYLKDLGSYIPYYTTGTGKSMRELAAGTKLLVPSTTGWDVNVRAIHTVPANAQIASFDKTTWIEDATYLAIPKGETADKLAVILDLMKWILRPASQAYAYDDGYMYPGPAIQGVTIGMATAQSRAVFNTYGRTDEYPSLIAKYPAQPPLPGDALAAMFAKWDSDIGGAKLK